MNASGVAGTRAAGAISIVAELADERLCALRVVSSRPTTLARLFLGRAASEIPGLAERLHSLCGVAHALAATQAIAAARGEDGSNCSDATPVALICERLSESFRSCAISLAESAEAPALGGAALRPLRDIFSATRELAVVATQNCSADGQAISRLAQRIGAAARELGLTGERAAARPPAGSWLGSLWREFAEDSSLPASAPDALTAADDPEVIDRLRREGERYCAEPSLSGRMPETGAFARRWRETELSRGALLARFEARLIDAADDVDKIAQAGRGEPLRFEGRSAGLETGEGFAAVETSRGRLYHWARLTPDDRIAQYAILAPTEWNFHPAGPFVAALLGATLERGTARRRITQLASLFDPCVAFRVELFELGHA